MTEYSDQLCLAELILCLASERRELSVDKIRWQRDAWARSCRDWLALRPADDGGNAAGRALIEAIAQEAPRDGRGREAEMQCCAWRERCVAWVESNPRAIDIARLMRDELAHVCDDCGREIAQAERERACGDDHPCQRVLSPDRAEALQALSADRCAVCGQIGTTTRSDDWIGR